MAQRFKARTLLSNSGVFNNEVIAPNLVYNTGAQTINGIKAFISRPTVNGTGILLSGEAGIVPSTVVQTSGTQIISGAKTFTTGVVISGNLQVSGTGIFNSLDLSNIDNLTLSGVDVILTSGAITLTNRPTVNGTGVLLSGEATRLPETVVYITGNQTISGIKSFATGIDIINSGNPQSLRVFNKTGLNTGEFGIFGWNNNQLTIGAQQTNSGILRDIILTGANMNLNASGAVIISNRNPPNTSSFILKEQNGNNSVFFNPTQNGGAGALFSNYLYSSNVSSRDDDNLTITYGGGGTKSFIIQGYNGSAYNKNLILDSNGNFTVSSGNCNVSGSGVFATSGATPLLLPNNPFTIVGSGNNYYQLNIQNRATGTSASADLVITANNGTDSTNYINLGINNSGYNDGGFTNGTGYDGYLFIDGGNLDIGTKTAGRFIEFHAGGTNQNNTIARITESGFNILSGNLTVSGNATITGHLSAASKSFLIDHPTQVGKKLQYGSLEGPEHGVFVRGKTSDKIINLPNYWSSLVDENSISVNLTPISSSNNIYVIDYNNQRVITNGNNGNDYFYTVYGERKDIPKLTVEF